MSPPPVHDWPKKTPVLIGLKSICSLISSSLKSSLTVYYRGQLLMHWLSTVSWYTIDYRADEKYIIECRTLSLGFSNIQARGGRSPLDNGMKKNMKWYFLIFHPWTKIMQQNSWCMKKLNMYNFRNKFTSMWFPLSVSLCHKTFTYLFYGRKDFHRKIHTFWNKTCQSDDQITYCDG